MHVVRVDGQGDPSEVEGASAMGAVRSSPLGFTIKTLEALAVPVYFASTMTRALVLAHASLAVAFLSPQVFSPRLLNK